jgi:hypothetical protein
MRALQAQDARRELPKTVPCVSSRVEVPASQVDRYLTRRLRRLAGFGAVSASVGYRLRAPDEEGCNWSGEVVLMCGAHAPDAAIIAATLPPLVEAARARFNLKE